MKHQFSPHLGSFGLPGFYLMDVQKKTLVIDSVKISLVVGTLLSLINQYGPVFSGEFDLELIVRLFFNFLIPFCVSVYSKYQMERKKPPWP